MWWRSRINSDWVRLAAEAYAQRVLATTETLETKPRKSQQFGWPLGIENLRIQKKGPIERD
jgi:hypothetical protein